ncbi:MAG: hypothetical protein J6A41_05145 [Ruminiclostridium sp.]|nr:hypothetical protein [Ruminiclostridium sp.]
MGIVIVFILLLCLGVSISFLATIALALIGIIVIAMDVFFIYATIIMLKGEKKAGRFIRSEQSGKSKIPYAIYEIDGTEYRNLLPLEVLLRNKIYNPEKNVSLILNEKKKCCFDNNARICCILGIVVSSFLIFEMAVLVIRNVLL